MLRLFIINLLLSLLWPMLTDEFSPQNLFIGFALGFAVLSLIEARYARFARDLIAFVLYVLYQILESNLRLAWLVIRFSFKSNMQIRPGIVGIPLEIRGEIEKTVLASIVTLTPGTLSVDLRRDRTGQEVLLVHSIDIAEPALFRQQIKEKFERRLLQIRQDLEGEPT